MSTLTVNISSDVERRVRLAAKKQNITVDEFVDGALKQITSPLEARKDELKPIPGTMSGAEMLAYWESVGALNRGDMTEDSVEYVQRTRREAERRDLS